MGGTRRRVVVETRAAAWAMMTVAITEDSAPALRYTQPYHSELQWCLNNVLFVPLATLQQLSQDVLAVPSDLCYFNLLSTPAIVVNNSLPYHEAIDFRGPCLIPKKNYRSTQTQQYYLCIYISFYCGTNSFSRTKKYIKKINLLLNLQSLYVI